MEPQNWHRRWKVAVVSSSMLYNFLGAWVCLSLNPFFITLMTYFDANETAIAWLVSFRPGGTFVHG